MKGKLFAGLLLLLALGLLLLLSGCDNCGDDFCPIPGQTQGKASICACLEAEVPGGQDQG
jgi:nitrous oxide reductase accessory protein NosL